MNYADATKAFRGYSRSATSLGTDLECFLLDSKGEVVPADNILPPEHRAINGKVFYDGIQAEVRTKSEYCRAWIVDDLVRVFRILFKEAQKADCTLSFQGAAPVTPEILLRAKDELSIKFGCEPHLSERLNGRVEPIRLNAAKHLVRYSGLHIHLGVNTDMQALKGASFVDYALQSAEGRLRTVRLLDLLVSNTFVLIEDEKFDRMRRKVYGKAGVYREKEYGLEYRTPSSILAEHPAYVNLAFSLARTARSIVDCKLDDRFWDVVDRNDVINAIDNVDKPLAYKNFVAIKPMLAALYIDEFYNHGLAAYEFMALRGMKFGVSPVDAWHMNNTVAPNHGNLTPTWETASRRLLSFDKDFRQFVTNWSPDNTYTGDLQVA